MSRIKMETIWQHDLVLPYILTGLKAKIEAVTPVRAIYLYGSRAKLEPKDWHLLEGKDWDILVCCDFPIVNSHIWTTALNYHIDLTVTDALKTSRFLQNNDAMIELFPVNKLEIKIDNNINTKDNDNSYI